jgi:hypothetical protein
MSADSKTVPQEDTCQSGCEPKQSPDLIKRVEKISRQNYETVHLVWNVSLCVSTKRSPKLLQPLQQLLEQRGDV